MNDDIVKMMMMGQMMGGGSEDGSLGGGLDLSSLMGLFGNEETTVESVWEDAVPFGTARDRNGDETVGILEIRITPPHADDPVPRVRIKSNGVILSRPEHILKVAKAFSRFADDETFKIAWDGVNSAEMIEAAENAAAEKRSTQAFSKLI